MIVGGRGLMRVGEEQTEVDEGTLVFIPPGTEHSIRNIGEEPLRYVSAASPPMPLPPPGSELAYSDP